MDLTKHLLQQKVGGTDPNSPSLTELGKIFFPALKLQLDRDLAYLSSQNDINFELFFKQVKVSAGNISENSVQKASSSKKVEKDDKAFIYIQIPGESGILLEPSKKIDTIFMYRATKVRQLLSNDFGETIRPELFILKSGIVEEFRILDENYVRSSNDKTLSVKQMSEMLLLLVHSLKSE